MWNYPAVRFLWTIFLLAAACMSARAQKQEATLEQRLTRPDMSLHSTFQDKKFEGGKTAFIDKKFEAKSFIFTQNSFDKTFSTKDFLGGKQDAASQKLFDTKGANTTTERVIPNADTKYSTKTADTRAAREAGKGYDVRTYETQRFSGRGTAQGAIDAERGKNKDMTIDDIRTLLNKNK